MTFNRTLPLFWLTALIGLTGTHYTAAKPQTTTAGTPQTCTVKKIYDGDTATLDCTGEKVKVRLYCIDAPEMKQEPWGTASRDHLRKLTPKTVTLKPRETDRYGRTVGELITPEGIILNLQMVKDGKATAYRQYCTDPAYLEAETAAQAAKLGIWATEGSHQKPSEWRKAHR